MRHVISCGSAKGFYLNRSEIEERASAVAREMLRAFPNVREVHLCGSVARGECTGLSDIDLAVIIDEAETADFLERARPFHEFFSRRLPIAADVFVVTESERERYHRFLSGSRRLVTRT